MICSKMESPECAAHFAAVHGNLETLKVLTECGYRIDRQDEFGETPLMECIMYDHRHIAKYIIDNVPNDSLLLTNRRYRWNVLHLMAFHGRSWRDIWFSIARRAPECLNQTDAENRTPEQLLDQMARKSEGHKTLNTFLKEDAVHIAAVQGDLDLIKMLSDCNTRLDEVDSFGDTPLMESIMYGHQNVADFLLGKVSPLSIVARNLKTNWNALHLMAHYGRPWRGIWNNIVQKAPQCLDQKDTKGHKPKQLLQQLSYKSTGHELLNKILDDEDHMTLHVSNLVKNDNLEQLQNLHREGWPLLTNTIIEQTLLLLAIENGRENIAIFLANAMSANPSIVEDNLNRNALHCMAVLGRPWNNVWRILSQKCPNILSHRDADRMTPVDLVIKNRDKNSGHKSLFEYVIMKGDMTNRINDLVRAGNLEELTNLQRKGWPLETQSIIGQTSLMLAISHDRENIAQFLAIVTSPYHSFLVDNFNYNALHYMATCGRPWNEVWQILSRKCPNLLYQKDGDKMTPVDLVIKNRDKDSSHKSLYEYAITKDIPSFIKALDEDTIVEFVCGLGEHAEETRNIKITIVGHEMVGKTCLVKQLFGENIDLPTLTSTNIADLHLRRLLLDMLTLEKISGTSAKDIVLDHLRMVISKIKEDEQKIETESRLTQESDAVKLPLPPVRNKGTNVTEFAKFTESQQADAVDSQTALVLDGSDLDRVPTQSGSVNTNLTEQQRNGIDLVLHQEADSRYKTKAFVTMYDFGGEDVFFNTHHSLLTSDSIYLLVFDLAMCLSRKDDQEGLDSMVKWLQWISTYAVDSNESRKGTPPVLLIGSHMDLVEKMEELPILDKIRSVPGMKEILDAHLKGFFPIANLHDSSKNADIFLKIWETIAEVAQLQSQWKKLIPGKWIALEFELLQKKESGVKVMTIEELMELNKLLTLPLEDIKSVKLFLRYLHMTGLMLCIDLESENPIIVLNAQWVSDAFKCLMTAIKFVTGLTTSERTQWKEFEKTGRLPVAVLKMLWGIHPNDKFLEHIHVLVAVMERLGLLVEPLPKDKNDKVDFYVVPSMLKKADGIDIDTMQRILDESTTVKSCTLCVQFQKRFIPQAIWDKFIAACIHRFQPFAVPDMRGFRHCYRGSVAVVIDRVWNLMIHCSGNVMKLTLFKMNGDSPVAPGTGRAIRLVLQDVLEQILTMNQQSHLKFDYYLHCDPIVRQNDVTVEAGRLLQTSPLDCIQTTVDGTVTVSIEREHYDVWFEKLSEKPIHVADVSRPRRPTCKELGRIAKFLYGAHHMFFIELGLLDAEISQIRHTCGHLSFRSQVTKIFLYWCNPTNPDVDVHQIARAMDTHGLDSQAMMAEIEHVKDDIILKGSEIPERHLNRAPEPDEVGIIAAFVDKSYFNLFLELDLQPHAISQCEMDHKDSGVKTMIIELLNVWIREFGEKATLKRILVAIKECNMAVFDLTTQLVLSIGECSDC